MRAASESTGLTDSCAKRMGHLQQPICLEFMDVLDYTTVIEFAEPLARRRGSALDR